jgi:MFS family permease
MNAQGSSARRREIITVYAIGLFQGLALVAFPAAATILQSESGYDLSRNQYGLLFLPQVIMAIAGALGLSTLSRRLGQKRVLTIGLAANTLAMGLLLASDPVQHDTVAYPMLLLATASLGLGFGITLGSISTYAGAFMPTRRDVALTALNVLLGLGTALSPLLVAVFTSAGHWWYMPLLAAAGLAGLLVLAALQPMVVPAAPGGETRAARQTLPALFWLFAGALVIYGIGETMFGNWGTTQLVGRGVSTTSANNALATFWAAVTVGRLVIAVVSSRINSIAIYVVLPWAMVAALALVPTAHSAAAGILVFAFGGLACSGFFPMTIGYGESRFPGIVELVTGWLIASYQLGYGFAAFGGGALQSIFALSTLFRVAAVLVALMGVLALVIARRTRPSAVPAAATGSLQMT